MNPNPIKVSFVACSRNDNHGGDMYKRMNIFVRGLIDQCNRFNLDAELLMVEWNPPADKPLLHEILPSTEKTDRLNIRYVVVPNELHSTLKHSERLPLYQMIAKNVGIRRAEGEFVCCTNVDLLFNDLLMEYMSLEKLEKGKFYRCNRVDVPKEIDEEKSTAELLEWCEANLQLRLGKHKYFANMVSATSPLLRYWIVQQFYYAYARIMARFTEPVKLALDSLDTEACGDFTMMHKDDWIRMGGYAEYQAYSLHIDSLGLVSAISHGIEQEIIHPNACCYHISHGGGWVFEDPIKKLAFDIQKPMIEWNTVQVVAEHVLRNGIPLNVAEDENWGFADKDLREIRVGKS